MKFNVLWGERLGDGLGQVRKDKGGSSLGPTCRHIDEHFAVVAVEVHGHHSYPIIHHQHGAREEEERHQGGGQQTQHHGQNHVLLPVEKRPLRHHSQTNAVTFNYTGDSERPPETDGRVWLTFSGAAASGQSRGSKPPAHSPALEKMVMHHQGARSIAISRTESYSAQKAFGYHSAAGK